MINWAHFTLLLYIIARMSGFVLFNPVFGRNNIPGIFRAGLILVLSVAVFYTTHQTVAIPATIVELIVRLCLELLMGFALGYVMNLFFSIPVLAGEMIDNQMGMTMAKTYDAGSQSSVSVSSTLMNILMVLLFFAANGHHTLLKILLTSGDLVPFGAVSMGKDLSETMVMLFSECIILSIKLCLPILGAELMGQIGMGILMKVIPQINVFAINIELKVIIGLLMMLILISPFSQFLLHVESTMLDELRMILSQVG